MIEGAVRCASAWPTSIRDRVTFCVGDCTKPLDLGDRPFDLVFDAWLLKYAATAGEQPGMWRNIFPNLRPGGQFIGVTPNVHMDAVKQPIDDRHGYAVGTTCGEGRGRVEVSVDDLHAAGECGV